LGRFERFFAIFEAVLQSPTALAKTWFCGTGIPACGQNTPNRYIPGQTHAWSQSSDLALSRAVMTARDNAKSEDWDHA
jgi:hypothetical protein